MSITGLGQKQSIPNNFSEKLFASSLQNPPVIFKGVGKEREGPIVSFSSVDKKNKGYLDRSDLEAFLIQPQFRNDKVLEGYRASLRKKPKAERDEEDNAFLNAKGVFVDDDKLSAITAWDDQDVLLEEDADVPAQEIKLVPVTEQEEKKSEKEKEDQNIIVMAIALEDAKELKTSVYVDDKDGEILCFRYVPEVIDVVFRKYDTDKNGKLSREEAKPIFRSFN